MMSMNPSDIAFLNITGTDYPCIINGVSKSEAVHHKTYLFFIVYKRSAKKL